MKALSAAIGVFAFCMVITSPIQGDEQRPSQHEEKMKAIYTFFEKTNVMAVGEQLAANLNQALLPLITSANPEDAEIAAAIVQEINARVFRKHRSRFEALMAGIYDRYFSYDEIVELLEFYDTPLGQKLTSTLPAITQEAFEIGQKFGVEIATEVVSELREALKTNNLEVPDEFL